MIEQLKILGKCGVCRAELDGVGMVFEWLPESREKL